MQERKQRAKNRPKRVPIGTRNVLNYPKRKGYVRRVVNDKHDRLEMFKAAWWEHVYEDVKPGADAAQDPKEQGGPVRKVTGKDEWGNPMYGYLMEIPEEYYKEDQKKAQDAITAAEQNLIDQPKQPGNYGNISMEAR